MKFHPFQRHAWLGLALQMLMHSQAMAQSAPVLYEWSRIAGLFKVINSDYVSPVAESVVANACREGILQVANTQLSGATLQAESLKVDANKLADVARLIPFFVEKSPNTTKASQFGDACLHSMLQALDPYSAYLDQSEFEKFIGPPSQGENTTANRDAANARIFVSKILDSKYLYLRVGSLDSSALRQLGSTLRAMEPDVLRGLSGIVLDLRRNPGGILTTSVGVAAAFLPTSTPVASTVGRNSKVEKYLAEPKSYVIRSAPDELRSLPAAIKALPLLVMVNRQTQAGAEAIAAALQDNKRAQIMGEQTPGNGTVQTFTPWLENTGIKLTTSKLVRPNGEEWAGKGVTPDHVTIQKVREGVELGSKDDDELAEALRILDKL
eukprot:gene31808-38453_t